MEKTFYIKTTPKSLLYTRKIPKIKFVKHIYTEKKCKDNLLHNKEPYRYCK